MRDLLAPSELIALAGLRQAVPQGGPPARRLVEQMIEERLGIVDSGEVLTPLGWWGLPKAVERAWAQAD
ncbi:hypothetical protein SAMN05421505_10913 [Sinosporangium album]|uniref:Uncharacterized protein n=1 Tax=Sinosporangium album TaxID=504805 RepID=A0A1G7XWV1_9ACTN|nr:hypothetical protein SAMN05421505_10913 [Sinosporangium album]